MVFKEPKVEFVSLELSEIINTSPGTGGGQYCKASQPEAKYCPGWNNDVDWGT